MSIPKQFRDAMDARWLAKGYSDTPLLYGYREVARTKSIDAVTLGNGRIVYHPGAYTGPLASAGQMSNEHAHAHPNARAYGSFSMLWTVHCHGFDPAYPDATSEGAECAHDDICVALKEMFFSVAKAAQVSNSWKPIEYGPGQWVRDPAERRHGELLVVEFSITVSMREAPELPIEYPTPKPTGIVILPNGNQATIVEVP